MNQFDIDVKNRVAEKLARLFLNESGELQLFDPNVYDIVNKYSNIDR